MKDKSEQQTNVSSFFGRFFQPQKSKWVPSVKLHVDGITIGNWSARLSNISKNISTVSRWTVGIVTSALPTLISATVGGKSSMATGYYKVNGTENGAPAQVDVKAQFPNSIANGVKSQFANGSCGLVVSGPNNASTIVFESNNILTLSVGENQSLFNSTMNCMYNISNNQMNQYNKNLTLNAVLIFMGAVATIGATATCIKLYVNHRAKTQTDIDETTPINDGNNSPALQR